MSLVQECRHARRANDRGLIEHMFSVARRTAHAAGLDYHRTEEFAGMFACTMFCYRQRDLLPYQQGQLPETWLPRCAIHTLRNYVRAEAVIRSHEAENGGCRR